MQSKKKEDFITIDDYETNTVYATKRKYVAAQWKDRNGCFTNFWVDEYDGLAHIYSKENAGWLVCIIAQTVDVDQWLSN